MASGPLAFTNGTTSSGLTYTFSALGTQPLRLADPADDVAFSNDGGATWTYGPTAGADGCDPLVTNVR